MLGGKKPSGLPKEVPPWEYRIFPSGWFLGKPVLMVERNGATPLEPGGGQAASFWKPLPPAAEGAGRKKGVSLGTYPVTLGNSIYFRMHFEVTMSP